MLASATRILGDIHDATWYGCGRHMYRSHSMDLSSSVDLSNLSSSVDLSNLEAGFAHVSNDTDWSCGMERCSVSAWVPGVVNSLSMALSMAEQQRSRESKKATLLHTAMALSAGDSS